MGDQQNNADTGNNADPEGMILAQHISPNPSIGVKLYKKNNIYTHQNTE